MRTFKVKYGIIPAVMFIGLTIALRSGVFSQDKATVQDTGKALTVKVMEAQYTDTVPKLSLTGSIESQTTAIVSAKLAGRIEEVLVQEGQYVRAGDPLVRLESVELANAVRTARDAVAKAQINYEFAQTDYNRYKKLYEIGAAPQQQMEAAEVKLKTAEADLSSARANLGNAEQQYGYGVITAPVDGVIANKTATVGQVVTPGAALMAVENIGQVYAVVHVEQKDLARVQVGQKAAVTVDAYPAENFAGVVEIMNPEAGSANRMFRTKVKLDNGDMALKPGMFAKVSLATGDAVQLLTVPQAAVIQKQGLYYVFREENGQVKRCPVEIGELTGEAIEIKAGLEAGDRVVVSNVGQLKDGDAVRISE